MNINTNELVRDVKFCKRLVRTYHIFGYQYFQTLTSSFIVRTPIIYIKYF